MGWFVDWHAPVQCQVSELIIIIIIVFALLSSSPLSHLLSTVLEHIHRHLSYRLINCRRHFLNKSLFAQFSFKIVKCNYTLHVLGDCVNARRLFSSSNDFSSQMQRIVINGKEYKINCSLIAPYQEVLQHAGYTKEGLTAVMVFQARKLPEKNVCHFVVSCLSLFPICIDRQLCENHAPLVSSFSARAVESGGRFLYSDCVHQRRLDATVEMG